MDAGVFLDSLGAIAYKEIKKNGEFVLPGFGKLVKQNFQDRFFNFKNMVNYGISLASIQSGASREESTATT
jgi:hypothetical protein